jgi:surface protein
VSDLHALGFSYYEMINSGIKMNGFIFDVSNSIWNAATNKYPIKNTGGSFSGLSTSFVQSTLTGLTTGFITWNSYTNLNVNDGLSFHSSVVSYSTNEKSIRILQFAGIPLANMLNGVASFARFGGSILATDVPSIPNKNMDSCFYQANTQVFGNIGSWDVSGVNTMVGTFKESKINAPIGSWNVSNVTNMNEMFRNATLFNQSISGWNVSKVTNMSYMFYECKNFNSDLSNWNVSNVTYMLRMFFKCTNFNGDLSNWVKIKNPRFKGIIPILKKLV